MDLFKEFNKRLKEYFMKKRTGLAGIQLIKTFEGFSPKPYLDAVGVPTIGYGATHYASGKRVTMADRHITEEEGDWLLREMLKQYEDIVNRNVKAKLNQNQFDALVSFVYNLGETNFRKSTLLKKINNNPNDKSIELEFAKWVKAGGRVLTGLVRRRKAESDLYFKHIFK